MPELSRSNALGMRGSDSITGIVFSSQLAIGGIIEREKVHELCGSIVLRRYGNANPEAFWQFGRRYLLSR
jgi:hypothetical protein